MKELSIEEKAERYDEALERYKAKQEYESQKVHEFIEYLFPELKESEDEKTWIINYLSNRELNSSIIAEKENLKKAIAWLEKQGEKEKFIKKELKCISGYRDEAIRRLNELEKQGEQKEYTFKSLPRLLDMIEPTNKAKAYCQKLMDTLINEGYATDAKIVGECLKQMNGEKVALATMDEKQSEQTPADKVELKFKVGDWITDGYLRCKITDVLDDRYIVDTKFAKRSAILFNHESRYHLWTIKDAKDGDVLACKSGWTCIFKALDNHANAFSSYCFMDSDKWFCDTGSECHTLNEEFVKAYNGEIYPATKEQRDLLFQKMKEAGYEWDAKKKELKKLEQKQVIDYPDNLPKDNWELVHEFVETFGRIPKDEDELNVLVEYVLKRQKPTEWSEEDEVKINRIVACLED